MANLSGHPSNLIPFKPGQSGNPGGKVVGARNRLTAKFLYELAEHFDTHGADAIQTVYEEKPDRYLQIVASLLPQKLDLNAPLEGMSDDDLSKKLELLEVLSKAIETQRAEQP
jgi:hypothetical protein